MTCPCGGSPRIKYNVLFRCRVICPACGRQTGWHTARMPAEMEWENAYNHQGA